MATYRDGDSPIIHTACAPECDDGSNARKSPRVATGYQSREDANGYLVEFPHESITVYPGAVRTADELMRIRDQRRQLWIAAYIGSGLNQVPADVADTAVIAFDRYFGVKK